MTRERMRAMERRARHEAVRYLPAIGLVAAAVLLRWAMPQVLGGTSFLVFFPAVVASAALFGMGPGLLATLLSTLGMHVLLSEPHGQSSADHPAQLVRVSLFTAGGVGISVAAGIRRRTRVAEVEQTRSLRESEQRFRSFVEASSQVVWTVNAAAEVDMAIPAWQAYTGQSYDEARGRGWMNAIHPEDRLRVAEAWRRAIESRGLYEVEYRLRIHDGTWRDVLARGVPVKEPDGTVREYIGTCIDITDRKRAEEQVRLQAAALEAAANGIAITDARGNILWVNQAFCDLTGYTRAEAVGQNPRILKSGRQDDAFYQDLWATIRRGQVWHGDLVNRRKDGTEYVEEMTIAPLRDGQGTIINFIAVKQDVSRRRAEQDALAVAKAAAEEATRAKDHFLAVLSHELRTPLTPVVTALAMLQSRTGFDEGTRESLEMIRRNVEMEARLIDDLLDVTRIARGKIELDRKPIHLGDVIGRAVEVCMPDIEARRLHFRMEAGPEAPHVVHADATRLQQVFWNLLRNAIKFTPSGGCVGVHCCSDGAGHVIVEVRDTGEGIEPGALERIFNAFEQAERSITRQFGGLGLGLTISKALVELHGGTISAHSRGKGAGAAFRVRLPLVTGQPQVEAAPRAPRRSVRPLRILLVEDHGDTARMMQQLLALDGHEVERAGDVATALGLAGRQAFDLLLSDLGLPDLSGLELMRELRARGIGIPGIALSGYGQEEDIRRSREAGFAAHLIKPISPERLADAIALASGQAPSSAPVTG